MAGKKPVDAPPPGAPLYMVSFGDMITIMLTFFILLCSYSTKRQAGFVADGVGSFRVGLNSMGLPGVMPGVRRWKKSMLLPIASWLGWKRREAILS